MSACRPDHKQRSKAPSSLVKEMCTEPTSLTSTWPAATWRCRKCSLLRSLRGGPATSPGGMRQASRGPSFMRNSWITPWTT
eukprot:scaffold3808_cov170-Ochromonas_danica.AAC.5